MLSTLDDLLCFALIALKINLLLWLSFNTVLLIELELKFSILLFLQPFLLLRCRSGKTLNLINRIHHPLPTLLNILSNGYQRFAKQFFNQIFFKASACTGKIFLAKVNRLV